MTSIPVPPPPPVAHTTLTTCSVNSVVKKEDKKSKDKAHLDQTDYMTIVSYLESPSNYDRRFGAGKTKVGDIKTKAAAFEEMASIVNSRSQYRLHLDVTQMQSRFQTYKSRYMKAKGRMNQTGFGLTAEEKNAGVTIAKKLDNMCPFFERMDMIFGKKANVEPAYAIDTTCITDDNEENKAVLIDDDTEEKSNLVEDWINDVIQEAEFSDQKPKTSKTSEKSPQSITTTSSTRQKHDKRKKEPTLSTAGTPQSTRSSIADALESS